MDQHPHTFTSSEPLRPNSASHGLLAGILITLSLVLLGFTAWFVYYSLSVAEHNYSVAESVSENSRVDISAEALTRSYADPIGLVGVKYPATWKVATDNADISTEHPYVTTTLTSPRGTVLHLNLDWGGRGGACFANEADKPFQPGNACPSSENLESEPSQIKNVYAYIAHVSSTSYSQTFGKSNIVLLTKHYADEAGKQQYVIGLSASNGDYPVVLRKPVMGYVVADDWFDTYDAKAKLYGEVHAYASFSTESLLKSQDARTVRSILGSMTINLPS